MFRNNLPKIKEKFWTYGNIQKLIFSCNKMYKESIFLIPLLLLIYKLIVSNVNATFCPQDGGMRLSHTSNLKFIITGS